MKSQDWSEDPEAQEWIRDVETNMLPKMRESGAVASIIPRNREGDVKFWVELGASIMLDKPIIAVVFDDGPLPPKLERIVDRIVVCREGATPEAAERIATAIHELTDAT